MYACMHACMRPHPSPALPHMFLQFAYRTSCVCTQMTTVPLCRVRCRLQLHERGSENHGVMEQLNVGPGFVEPLNAEERFAELQKTAVARVLIFRCAVTTSF